jgi:predicted O-linked N-acetylglucosamine transferase (SPINDLY family)
MGLSMMTAIGLAEFVARSPREYIEIARKSAADLPRLAEFARRCAGARKIRRCWTARNTRGG